MINYTCTPDHGSIIYLDIEAIVLRSKILKIKQCQLDIITSIIMEVFVLDSRQILYVGHILEILTWKAFDMILIQFPFSKEI